MHPRKLPHTSSTAYIAHNIKTTISTFLPNYSLVYVALEHCVLTERFSDIDDNDFQRIFSNRFEVLLALLNTLEGYSRIEETNRMKLDFMRVSQAQPETTSVSTPGSMSDSNGGEWVTVPLDSDIESEQRERLSF